MINYSIKITLNDEDSSQARIILEVNGHEIDILSDANGINAELKNTDGCLVASMNHDWL